MDTITQQHLEAIESVIPDAYDITGSGIKGAKEAASNLCSEITLSQMKNFAEWLDKNEYELEGSTTNNTLWHIYPLPEFYTLDELLTLYLNSNQGNEFNVLFHGCCLLMELR